MKDIECDINLDQQYTIRNLAWGLLVARTPQYWAIFTVKQKERSSSWFTTAYIQLFFVKMEAIITSFERVDFHTHSARLKSDVRMDGQRQGPGPAQRNPEKLADFDKDRHTPRLE